MTDIVDILDLKKLENAVVALEKKVTALPSSESVAKVSAQLSRLNAEKESLVLRLQREETRRIKVTKILDQTIGHVEQILTVRKAG